MSLQPVAEKQATKHDPVYNPHAHKRKLFLHCENGRRIPFLTDESVQSVVDNYLDRPFFWAKAATTEDRIVCCVEFSDPVRFVWNGHPADLLSVYTLSDRYMRRHHLNERIRMRVTVHYPVGVAMNTSAAYIPGLFDAAQDKPQNETPPTVPDPDTRLTRRMVLDYAAETSHESAANLLLLLGPDGYAGDYQDYNELMYILTNSKP